jgi:hypothetical protein
MISGISIWQAQAPVEPEAERTYRRSVQACAMLGSNRHKTKKGPSAVRT